MNTKIIIAGVGGQGVVYLSNLLVEAALLSNIPVNVSEIHGLSQRGGVVTSGIGLGEHCSGFIGKASVDFLIGLEPLETQRCLPYLHKNSCVVFGNDKIPPHTVNAEISTYPDIKDFYLFLNKSVKEVKYIEIFPEDVESVFHNIFLLGIAVQLKYFPFNSDVTIQAINSIISNSNKDKTINIFLKGVCFKKNGKK